MENKKYISSIIIAFALVAFGFILAFASGQFSKRIYYVSVKGLAEKIVKADTAIWPISFKVQANTADEIYKQAENNIKIVKDFLIKNGFKESEISFSPFSINTHDYRDAKYSYSANVVMSVYTQKVDKVKKLSQNMLPLLKKGILIGASYGNYIDFRFTKLNDIKPDMLAESTKNAKEAAMKFTQDSGMKVGKVAEANQGLFSISDKDPGSPEYKKVRVISNFKFLLD